jgi:hypothetical protein
MPQTHTGILPTFYHGFIMTGNDSIKHSIKF